MSKEKRSICTGINVWFDEQFLFVLKIVFRKCLFCLGVQINANEITLGLSAHSTFLQSTDDAIMQGKGMAKGSKHSSLHTQFAGQTATIIEV